MPDTYEVRRDARNVWYLRNNRALFFWRDGEFWCCDWNLRRTLQDFLNCSPDAPLHVQADILPWMQRQAAKAGSFPVLGLPEITLPPPLLPPPHPVSHRQYEAFKKRALAEGESESSAECIALASLRRIGGTRDALRTLLQEESSQSPEYQERILAWAFGARGDAYLVRNGFRFLNHPAHPAAPDPGIHLEEERELPKKRKRRPILRPKETFPEMQIEATLDVRPLFGKRRRHSFQKDDILPRASRIRDTIPVKKQAQREEDRDTLSM